MSSSFKVGDVVEHKEMAALGIIVGFHEHGGKYKNVLIDWVLAPLNLYFDRSTHPNNLGNYDAGDEQMYASKNFRLLGNINE